MPFPLAPFGSLCSFATIATVDQRRAAVIIIIMLQLVCAHFLSWPSFSILSLFLCSKVSAAKTSRDRNYRVQFSWSSVCMCVGARWWYRHELYALAFVRKLSPNGTRMIKSLLLNKENVLLGDELENAKQSDEHRKNETQPKNRSALSNREHVFSNVLGRVRSASLSSSSSSPNSNAVSFRVEAI